MGELALVQKKMSKKTHLWDLHVLQYDYIIFASYKNHLDFGNAYVGKIKFFI